MRMLELKNITYAAQDEKGKNDILNGINLALESGRFYVITGPNGGGKSTLAKIIMGIIQPTSGEIWFEGKNITDASITDRAKMGIGYSFQQAPRFKGIKVGELLNLAADKDRKKRAYCETALREVGLCTQDYINRDVDASLSGGELKRIEIATLLNRKLKLALFDEPEAGIDLWSFAKLTETFSALHKGSEGTIVIISHQERILELADEIIMIRDGVVAAQDSKEKILPGILCSPEGCELGKGEKSYACIR